MKAWWMFWLLLLPLQGTPMAQVVSVAGGSTECALWTQARNASDAAIYEHFVLGCLNGLSVGTGKEFWRASEGPDQSGDGLRMDGQVLRAGSAAPDRCRCNRVVQGANSAIAFELPVNAWRLADQLPHKIGWD